MTAPPKVPRCCLLAAREVHAAFVTAPRSLGLPTMIGDSGAPEAHAEILLRVARAVLSEASLRDLFGETDDAVEDAALQRIIDEALAEEEGKVSGTKIAKTADRGAAANSPRDELERGVRRIALMAARAVQHEAIEWVKAEARDCGCSDRIREHLEILDSAALQRIIDEALAEEEKP